MLIQQPVGSHRVIVGGGIRGGSGGSGPVGATAAGGAEATGGTPIGGQVVAPRTGGGGAPGAPPRQACAAVARSARHWASVSAAGRRSGRAPDAAAVAAIAVSWACKAASASRHAGDSMSASDAPAVDASNISTMAGARMSDWSTARAPGFGAAASGSALDPFRSQFPGTSGCP